MEAFTCSTEKESFDPCQSATLETAPHPTTNLQIRPTTFHHLIHKKNHIKIPPSPTNVPHPRTPPNPPHHFLLKSPRVGQHKQGFSPCAITNFASLYSLWR